MPLVSSHRKATTKSDPHTHDTNIVGPNQLASQIHHRATAMDHDGAESRSQYKDLLDRFQSLEASHVNLQEQFKMLLQEKVNSNGSTNSSGSTTSSSSSGGSSRGSRGKRRVIADSSQASTSSYPGWGDVPGAYFTGSPYRNVLANMGHAVHVSKIGSGEIKFWNRAAEKLFGYKEHEVLGYKDIDVLYNEDYHPSAIRMLEMLSKGISWAGQLPLRKRSGKVFMALVTKSPLYEDEELVGIVTNASDATLFNSTVRTQEQVVQAGGRKISCTPQEQNSQPGERRKISWIPQEQNSQTGWDRFQCRTRAQIAAVPHIAASVSNLASRVLSRKSGDANSEAAESVNRDVRADRPPRTPTTKPVFGVFTVPTRPNSMSSEWGG